ncbi:ABC transporter ATP-binding protein [Thermococcus gorgonarius]|uniref:ABC transporter n=1 Tax=Thermococcus gorgonarius TaxID=71997 RepID=A0A2Z2MEX8_THEGO|nr:ABC transporter ATP-binding protein [Thermococcus gorgonarius]ASJ00558.1 ABC transporter [Thermococcus gorgonarius]
MIKAVELRKYFGSIKALDGLTVDMPKGVNLVVGPNGGGKSTFFKIAAGVYRPTGGKIRVLGKDPWVDADFKRKVGVSFDPAAFPPLMSGREWLSLFAEYRGGSVKDVADLLELDFLDRRVREYSSGMRKKLSLAQAFLGDPELIMLDEPLANLDFDSMGKVVEVIDEFRDGSSFLLISHIWEPLLPVVDRIYLISNGKLVAQGGRDEMAGRLKAIYSLSEP